MSYLLLVLYTKVFDCLVSHRSVLGKTLTINLSLLLSYATWDIGVTDRNSQLPHFFFESSIISSKVDSLSSQHESEANVITIPAAVVLTLHTLQLKDALHHELCILHSLSADDDASTFTEWRQNSKTTTAVLQAVHPSQRAHATGGTIGE